MTASIQLWALEVKADQYHLYIIHTKENGEKWVLRAGPTSSLVGFCASVSAFAEQLAGGKVPEYGFVDMTYEQLTHADGTVFEHSAPEGMVFLDGNTPRAPADSSKAGDTLYSSSQSITGPDAFIQEIMNSLVQEGQNISNAQYAY